MLPLERRKWIEDQILINGKIDIESSSKQLNVSSMTIRRDLKELENEKKVIRTHGGAVSPESLITEVPYSSKKGQNINEKKTIALRAKSIIKPESTIILDSGTTTLELAKLLKGRNDLTIVTNDIKIAGELMSSLNKVIVTGGEMQKDIGALFGAATQHILKVIHADVFFLGAHAVDISRGVTSPTFDKSLIKQLMIDASKETWLLADYSKFGKKAFSNVCSLTDLDGVVTDSNLESSINNQIESSIPVLYGGEL